MRTVLTKSIVELNVTKTVALLSVKVLYGKGITRKLITSDHTAPVLLKMYELGWLVNLKIDVVSLSVNNIL